VARGSSSCSARDTGLCWSLAAPPRSFTSSTFHPRPLQAQHIHYDAALITIRFHLRNCLCKKAVLTRCCFPALFRQPARPRFSSLGFLYNRSAASRKDFPCRPIPNFQGTTERCCIAPVGSLPRRLSLAHLVARLSGHWFPAVALFLSASVPLLANLTHLHPLPGTY
jgi:hypothetical protein